MCSLIPSLNDAAEEEDMEMATKHEEENYDKED
jgi:hypothetical protein